MKKVLSIIFCLVVLCVIDAKAQLGIRVGESNRMEWVQTDLYGITADTSIANHGAYVGLDLEVKLSGSLSAILGVDVFGYRKTSELVGNTSVLREVYDLEVPLWLNYKLKLTEAIALSVFAGPRVNYCLTFKETTSGVTETVHNFLDAVAEGDNVLDQLSYSANVGVAFHVNKFRVSVDYCLGVKDLMNQSSISSFKYNRINVGVGLRF